MEEYWNLFLNWLNSIGASNLKRIAPKAELRYANSKKSRGKYGWHDADIIEQNVKKSMIGGNTPAKMYRYENAPGDTTFVEYPEREINPWWIGTIRPRMASTLDPRGDEYRILHNIWDIADSLAQ